jgi:ABC-type methionine transport system permease subunit
MKKENLAPWYVVARRFIPYIILMYIMLPLCYILIVLGYGFNDARRFWEATT